MQGLFSSYGTSQFGLVIFFKTQTLIFRAVLSSQQNQSKYRDISHVPHSPTHAEPPLLSAFPTTVVHLLELMTLE